MARRIAEVLHLCILAAGFTLASARPLLALTPQGCANRVVRGAATPQPESRAETVLLHISGGWSNAGPPRELRIRHAETTEERVLELGPVPIPRDNHIRLYRARGGELATGVWQLTPDDFSAPGDTFAIEDSAFYVFEPSTSSLVLEVEVEARFQTWPWGTTPLSQFAEATLVLTIEVPAAWQDRVPADALLGVRLGVDAVPDDSAELAEDDRFIVAHDDGHETIVMRNFLNYMCFAGATADWVDGTTLHGLLWPIGQDPAQVSMRFTLELADLRTEVTRLHDETFQMDPMPDASEPDEPESAEPDAGDAAEIETDAARGMSANPETSSTGCAALPTRSRADVGAVLAFLAIALLRRRVMRLRSR